MKILEAYNFLQINERVSSSGTLMNIDLESLSNDKYSTVINLLPDDNKHTTHNEAESFQALSIGYHYIPVDWDAPKPADYQAFEIALIAAKNQKTHIHCAANYRATAFYGLYAYKHLGWSKKQIMKFTAPIWQLSDYPIWLNFVEELTAET